MLKIGINKPHLSRLRRHLDCSERNACHLDLRLKQALNQRKMGLVHESSMDCTAHLTCLNVLSLSFSGVGTHCLDTFEWDTDLQN